MASTAAASPHLRDKNPFRAEHEAIQPRLVHLEARFDRERLVVRMQQRPHRHHRIPPASCLNISRMRKPALREHCDPIAV